MQSRKVAPVHSEDPLITAVIKARNEAAQIAECIRSARDLADEIVVVDNSSTDETRDLAESEGARVIKAASEGGRINALDRIGFLAARGSWIIRLDADERIVPTLAERLRALAFQDGIDGARFARKNMMFGSWARHGGWFVSDQLRFFRKAAWDREDRDWERSLHDHPTIAGTVVTLPADPRLATVHHDYETISQFVSRTFKRYARTEARWRLERGDSFSRSRLFVAPARRFVGRFIVRRGFRDGTVGLVLAVLLALDDLFVELHMWDLAREAQTKPASPSRSDAGTGPPAE